MNIIRKRLRQLVIEGSRHNKKHNLYMRVGMYSGLPLFLSMWVFFVLGYGSERTIALMLLATGLVLLAFMSTIVAYHYDKGYRQRDTITEEEYASLSYKPLSYAYTIWSLILSVVFLRLNEHYLHWF